MTERRRIVPDNSILVEAIFAEGGGVRLQRATQFLHAVLSGHVLCLAPDTLVVEFTKVAFDFRNRRRSHRSLAGVIEAQLQSFLELPINYIPSMDLAKIAIGFCHDIRISPTDSWYLAAAAEYSAELWISHWHADGFTKKCAQVHEQVFTLADDDFFGAGRSRKG